MREPRLKMFGLPGKLAALAICCTLLAAAGDELDRSCLRTDIPVKMLEDAHLKVDWQLFEFGEHGHVTLALVNETGSTITSLIVLVSYFDPDGKLIFATPFFGGPDDSQIEMEEIRPYIKTILSRPIRPGEGFQLVGANLELTTQLPARAEVTLVDTTFAEGNNVVTFSSNQVTDPLLLKLPDFFEMHADDSELPDEVPVAIRVDERGRVTDVDLGPSFAHSPNIADQIKAQLELWSFFPATTTGYAVQSRLSLLLRFHQSGIPLPLPACPLLLPNFLRNFVPIDLRREGAERWSVLYGGQSAHGSFSTIVSVGAAIKTAHDAKSR